MHPNFALLENYTVLLCDSHKGHLIEIKKDHVEESDHFNADTNEFTDKEGAFGAHKGAPEDHSGEEAMKKFGKNLCDALMKKHQKSPFHKLIIAAPARMLNIINDNLHAEVQKVLEKTVQGEFVNMPHNDVVEHL